MRCPKCNNKISFQQSKCEHCGEDLMIYKKITGASNGFYNNGLARAQVRDLSGAEASLKKSLELDKKNIDARNLLGLIYYEMGETVKALSQWVISKHFKPDHNRAEEYVKELQENPAALEKINQLIKKYNQALQLAKEGNEDLAVIQLKKVTSLNPKFIQAQQLLALLYLKMEEKEKAKKCLNYALKTDFSNTRTARYLNEVGERFGSDSKAGYGNHKSVKQTTSVPSYEKYQEDKTNIWVFINLIIGALIGISFVYFLIVPTVKKDAEDDYKEQLAAQVDITTSKESSIENLNDEIEMIHKQLSDKDNDIQELKDRMIDEKVYDNLFDAIKFYEEGNNTQAAKKLLEVNAENLTSEKAKNYYKTIQDATYESVSKTLYKEGKTRYNVGRYDESISLFEDALKLKKDNVDALYFLARAYDRKGNKDLAEKYYNQVMNDFPDSNRAKEAETKLSYLVN